MKAILVACSDNRVIGNHGDIPWMGRMPADMRYVRELTMGNAIIMGMNTFRSIGRPLPGRQNIVLTRDTNFNHDGLDIASSLDQAILKVEPGRDSYIFGGARVYKESLDRAKELGVDTILVTEIHNEFEGDAYFPEIDMSIWKEVDRKDFPADQGNLYPYSLVRYEPIS